MAKLTPMKAIRRYCIDCGAGSYNAVRKCEEDGCPLFVYRFGKRPLSEGNVLTSDDTVGSKT